MMQAETLEAIRRCAAIPSMPLVATRCFELTNDPLCNYDRLVELLSTDPGIAADVLRLANSPLFGAMREVKSLKQAVTLLGLRRTRELVLTRYLVQRIEDSGAKLIDMTYFWRRSLTTAVVASRLVEVLEPKRREEAFLAGLLADVGVLILARALPTRYAAIAAQYTPFGGDDWIVGEYTTLGVTHGEVSALLLEDWSLPGEIADVVRHHHTADHDASSDAAGGPVAALARIVSAAGTIARTLCEARDPVRSAERCQAAMESVGLDATVLAECFPHIESDVENLAKSLRVDVIPDKIYKLIAEQIRRNLLPARA